MAFNRARKEKPSIGGVKVKVKLQRPAGRSKFAIKSGTRTQRRRLKNGYGRKTANKPVPPPQPLLVYPSDDSTGSDTGSEAGETLMYTNDAELKMRKRALKLSNKLRRHKTFTTTVFISGTLEGNGGISLVAAQDLKENDIIARYIVRLYDTRIFSTTIYSTGSQDERYVWDIDPNISVPLVINNVDTALLGDFDVGGQLSYIYKNQDENNMRNTLLEGARIPKKKTTRHKHTHFRYPNCNTGLCGHGKEHGQTVMYIPPFAPFSNEPTCKHNSNCELIESEVFMDGNGDRIGKFQTAINKVNKDTPVYSILFLTATKNISNGEAVEWCYGDTYNGIRTIAGYEACLPNEHEKCKGV